MDKAAMTECNAALTKCLSIIARRRRTTASNLTGPESDETSTVECFVWGPYSITYDDFVREANNAEMENSKLLLAVSPIPPSYLLERKMYAQYEEIIETRCGNLAAAHMRGRGGCTEGGEGLCAICHDKLPPVGNGCAAIHSLSTRVLSCGHLYHRQCITPWLQRSARCPECRLGADPLADQDAADSILSSSYDEALRLQEKAFEEICKFSLSAVRAACGAEDGIGLRRLERTGEQWGNLVDLDRRIAADNVALEAFTKASPNGLESTRKERVKLADLEGLVAMDNARLNALTNKILTQSKWRWQVLLGASGLQEKTVKFWALKQLLQADNAAFEALTKACAEHSERLQKVVRPMFSPLKSIASKY